MIGGVTAHSRYAEALAVVVIAHGTRRIDLLSSIVASALEGLQGLDEIIVVGDEPTATMQPLLQVPYVCVPAVTTTTVDALAKRDAGWLVTEAPAVCFLADDHKLGRGFRTMYRQRYAYATDWDFLRPWRIAERDGMQYVCNNGSDQYGEYVGGHGGIYRRICARRLPWSCIPHRNWDLLHAKTLTQLGLRLRVAGAELAIEDIEKGSRPWE